MPGALSGSSENRNLLLDRAAELVLRFEAQRRAGGDRRFGRPDGGLVGRGEFHRIASSSEEKDGIERRIGRGRETQLRTGGHDQPAFARIDHAGGALRVRGRRDDRREVGKGGRRARGDGEPRGNRRVARAEAVAQAGRDLGQLVRESLLAAALDAAEGKRGLLRIGGREFDAHLVALEAFDRAGERQRAALENGGIAGRDAGDFRQARRFDVGERIDRAPDRDGPRLAKKDDRQKQHERDDGQRDAAALVRLAVAHLPEVEVLPFRHAGAQIGGLERIALGIPRELEIVDEVVVELGKSLLDRGRDALMREPLPQRGADEPERAAHQREQDDPGDDAIRPFEPQPEVGQAQQKDPADDRRETPSELQFRAPANEVAADLFESVEKVRGHGGGGVAAFEIRTSSRDPRLWSRSRCPQNPACGTRCKPSGNGLV